MIRGMVLAQWEIRRMLRSKPIIALLIVTPVVCALAASRLAASPQTYSQLLVTSALVGWLLIYIRSLYDRATGFSDGIESTPAAGTSVYLSKIILGFIVTLLQTAIFCTAARLTGF